MGLGRVPWEAGQQVRQASCSHWSGGSWGRPNKTLRDVRVANITIDVIRSNWDCNHKLLQAVHKVICTLV